jgi:hypothetical protein
MIIFFAVLGFIILVIVSIVIGKRFGWGRVSRTNEEVIQILQSTLDGTASSLDWDNFVSVQIKDPVLDGIRKMVLFLDDQYPPRNKDEWCNPDGQQVIQKIIQQIQSRRHLTRRSSSACPDN